MPEKLKNFLSNEVVLLASFVLAAASAFFVPPDVEYIGYIDWRTLAILFCLMAVMAGLRRLNVFRQIGQALIGKVRSMRALAAVLVLLCYFFSMFITNDVALLTFVPFTLVTLHIAGQDRQMIPVIVLQTIAANLGSMITPIGNPQNLYLYGLADMSLGAFLRLMLPYGACALLLLLGFCIVCSPRSSVQPQMHAEFSRTGKEKVRLGILLGLFAISLLVVARVLPWPIAFGVVLITLLIFDRPSLGRIDYSLLLTFIFLFIFIGNLKRIDAVSTRLSELVNGHEVLTSVLASQIISNVPAAVLLSGFTDNIPALILGTDLGGLGTLIASMASLISFKQYTLSNGAKKGKYLAAFTALNILFLAVLYGLYIMIN